MATWKNERRFRKPPEHMHMIAAAGQESERDFAYRITAIVSLGFLVTVAGATYVDARIPSHVRYGARVYPYGYWVALLVIPLSAATFAAMIRASSRGWKCAAAVVPLICAVASSLWAFAPEMPHQGVTGYCLIYGATALIATWLRNSESEIRFIRDKSLPLQVRLEGLKSAITLWQGIALGTCAGFLAGVIPWTAAVVNANSHVVTAAGDVFLLNGMAILQIGIISVTFVIGPIREAVSSVMRLTARFPEITGE